MSINSKLTALADTIRYKTGASGRMTIDGMINAVAGISSAGTSSQFVSRTFEYEGRTLHYLYHAPSSAKPSAGYPLLVYLHSAVAKNEFASDLDSIRDSEAFVKMLDAGLLGTFNSYVIAPKITDNDAGWHNLSAAVAALAQSYISDVSCGVNAGRVGITGFSLGATGALDIACGNSVFKKIVTIAGKPSRYASGTAEYNTDINSKKSAFNGRGANLQWRAFTSRDDEDNPSEDIEALVDNTGAYTAYVAFPRAGSGESGLKHIELQLLYYARKSTIFDVLLKKNQGWFDT